jgi:hypothetical protein
MTCNQVTTTAAAAVVAREDHQPGDEVTGAGTGHGDIPRRKLGAGQGWVAIATPNPYLPTKISRLRISGSQRPNTLSARLKVLEENEIVARRFYEDHPPRAEYLLTDKGRELGPVLKSLLAWGQKHTRRSAAS